MNASCHPLGPMTVVAALVCAAVAGAQVTPGEIVTSKDAGRVEELVSPGILWLVRHGMDLEIVPYQRHEPPPTYREATEKYSSQVRLRPDGVLDEATYVAGQPFPILDPNDPQIAVKVMYNVQRGRFATDDFTIRMLETDGGTMSVGDGASTFRIEVRKVIESFRLLRYVGRTEKAPVPRMPNPLGVLDKFGFYPLLAPYEERGNGLLYYRYLDPERDHDSWLYVPGFRRVRRFSRTCPAPRFPGEPGWYINRGVDEDWFTPAAM